MREDLFELIQPTSIRVIEDRKIIQDIFSDNIQIKEDNTYIKLTLADMQNARGDAMKRDIEEMVR